MKKVWLNLPEELLAEMREFVTKGKYANRTELIRDSIRRRIEEIRREEQERS